MYTSSAAPPAVVLNRSFSFWPSLLVMKAAGMVMLRRYLRARAASYLEPAYCAAWILVLACACPHVHASNKSWFKPCCRPALHGAHASSTVPLPCCTCCCAYLGMRGHLAGPRPMTCGFCECGSAARCCALVRDLVLVVGRLHCCVLVLVVDHNHLRFACVVSPDRCRPA